jgi:hypothetical protein
MSAVDYAQMGAVVVAVVIGIGVLPWDEGAMKDTQDAYRWAASAARDWIARLF